MKGNLLFEVVYDEAIQLFVVPADSESHGQFRLAAAICEFFKLTEQTDRHFTINFVGQAAEWLPDFSREDGNSDISYIGRVEVGAALVAV